MQHIAIFTLCFSACILLSACSFSQSDSSETALSGEVSQETANYTSLYGEFKIDGIQGKTLDNPGIADNILVMTTTNSSIVSHLLIHHSTRKSFSEEDLSPGTIVTFSGIVEVVNARAGTSYYIDQGDRVGINTFKL